jgi:adenylyltransferase/sulfurtransferase
LSNLHRQVIHDESSVGTSKVDSAIRRLKGLNSTLEYSSTNTAITHDNCLELLRPYDIVVDATDNTSARYLLSDTCVLLKIPLVSGSAGKILYNSLVC